MHKVKKFQGKIIKKGSGKSLYYLNQIIDEFKWIHTNHYSRYLRSIGLTEQEYYNIVVYGDKNSTPKMLLWK